ncbi:MULTISPECIES: SEL1-like repeat protein [Achromobacter]|uniref:Uncharacterized protein n=1 Tax=Achromobacter xylosoxidans (strain A8) TaxID=762376 RepID=E3HYA0_ACHXA|nr:hypothetical protein [Achromobacter xylosoxidans]ADP20054.1 hypothetical protein AXYL_06772 [Achromobacter xylosoxidans A8]
MQGKPSPIQARNTILARDIADKLSAQVRGAISVPTVLELVAAARGYASYAAYTAAVKDKTEPADFKMAQLWLFDSKIVQPRIDKLGLAEKIDTAGLAFLLQGAINDLMKQFPDRQLVAANSLEGFFADVQETIVCEAINKALNPRPKPGEVFGDEEHELNVVPKTLSVAKIGPLPQKVGGWLRASFYGDAEVDDSAGGDFAEPKDEDVHGFVARLRLRRMGKQLYTGCQAEILILNDLVAHGIKSDFGSDPDDFADLIAAGDPSQESQLRGLKLLRNLEQSGRVPTLGETDSIVDSFSSYPSEQLELIETYAGALAVRLINMKRGLPPQQGVRILEALVANGCQFSKLSLAHALFNGWGCDEDSARARSLVAELLALVRSGKVDFLEPASYAELYSLGAKLSMQAGDRRQAFELYRSAAAEGHGPSALILVSFLMPRPAGDAPDEFSGVVEPNLKLAEAYYLQAMRAGYNPATQQFNPQEVK